MAQKSLPGEDLYLDDNDVRQLNYKNHGKRKKETERMALVEQITAKIVDCYLPRQNRSKMLL